MPKLVIENLGGLSVEIQEGKTLLQNIQAAYVDWMHPCGGKGRCTGCKMQIVSGGEQLSPPSPQEQHFMTQGRLRSNERLACQCTLPQGELRVLVPHECQLPHLHYHFKK